MPDGDLFRTPDKRSGPALLDREPVVLPNTRKRMARKLKRKLR